MNSILIHTNIKFHLNKLILKNDFKILRRLYINYLYFCYFTSLLKYY